jgi:C4-dicarboxylate-specific signal transduction histidine kinase
MEAALQTGQTQQYTFSLPDGRSFEQAYTPITDVDGRKKALVLLRDVTEERASSAAMMRAEQLAALGEMAAGVAHEINNPINGIINYAHVLRKKARAGSLTSSFAGRIIKEGDRIASIVEGLLTFARRKKEGRTAVRVGDIVNDALTLSGAQLRKDAIHLETDIPENLPHVMAQPQEIEQVFINIISNARHALQSKYPESHRNKVLRISAEPFRFNRRDYVRVSFLDKGCGIPAAIIDRVMNPFFTTKTEGKRTGLGLSISHGIMQDHDGRLTVKSRHGEYTRIDVDLPAQPASAL